MWSFPVLCPDRYLPISGGGIQSRKDSRVTHGVYIMIHARDKVRNLYLDGVKLVVFNTGVLRAVDF